MEVMLARSSPAGPPLNSWETNSSPPPPAAAQAGGGTSDHLEGTISGEVPTSKGGIDSCCISTSSNGARRISSPVDQQGTRRITSSPIEQIASPTRGTINSPTRGRINSPTSPTRGKITSPTRRRINGPRAMPLLSVASLSASFHTDTTMSRFPNFSSSSEFLRFL